MEDEPLLKTAKHVVGKIQNNGSINEVQTANGDLFPEIDEKERDPGKGVTCQLLLAVSSCIFGSPFVFGFNNGVINTPINVLQEFFNVTNYDRTGQYMSGSTLTLLWAVTVSIYAIGGMFGGLSGGYLANRYGRKGLMLRNSVLAVFAGGLLFFSKICRSYEMLIVGRMVVGVSAGISSVVAPLYLSEIAPVKLRGFFGALYQLTTVLGIITSGVLGLGNILGTADLWQYALGFTVVPAIYQILTIILCPETPRYLMIYKYEETKAGEALNWLRGKNANVEEELWEMHKEREKQNPNEKFLFLDLFRKPGLRTPVMISVMMHLSQQFCGINAVVYYSTSIFENVGLSEINAQYATLGSGAANILMTFVSASLMDRLGRRTLFLASQTGLFVFSLTFSIAYIFQSSHQWLTYVCVVTVIVYRLTFAIGTGSIPWFFVAELFSQRARPSAVSLATVVHWLSNSIVALLFPELQKWIGAYSFIPFVCLLALFLLFGFFKVPETKGKTIEEITMMFERDKNESQQSSIPWFFVAELFSQRARPSAVSLATVVHWLSNSIVALLFPELQKWIGSYSFIPFVCLLALFLIFGFWKVPETKGKTIEEITMMFEQDKNESHQSSK